VDFVVVGLGSGALGLLLGLVLHDGGSWWSRVRGDRTLPPADVVRRLTRGRACRAGGRVLAIAGAGACLATVLALLLRLSDRRGAEVVVAFLLAGIGGALAWGVAYAHRYHSRPVRLRPRPRTLAPNMDGTGAAEPVAIADAPLLAAPEPPSTATVSTAADDVAPDDAALPTTISSMETGIEQAEADHVRTNGASPTLASERPVQLEDEASSLVKSLLANAVDQGVEETSEAPGEPLAHQGRDEIETTSERIQRFSPAGKVS
jgi:hypothetical protein